MRFGHKSFTWEVKRGVWANLVSTKKHQPKTPQSYDAQEKAKN